MPVKVKAARFALALGAVALVSILAGCTPRPSGQATSGWDLRRAEREGEVVVYINNDVHQRLVEDFERRFPKVKLRFVVLTSRDMQARVIEEAKDAEPVADVVWTSAIDTQVKLINDGYAQTYRSPEAGRLPAWARWRDQGFGVTSEPIVFVYNKRLLKDGQAPRSHSALLAALRADPERWRGKVAMYDPERSGMGFFYLSSNTQFYPDGWALYDALAAVDVRTYVPGKPMLDRVATGEHLLAVDINGSYADWYVRNNGPDVGYVVPEDYHLSISRVAFITRVARHPGAARLFLDYLMSDAGQRVLSEVRLTPIRPGLGAAPPSGARPIRVGPALLANFDQGRRAELLSRWRGGEAAE
ncbi:ABC transporter substrate-binding protein [Caulobacter endophyticus]|uniref:ABC transporter substrate-binding protein n=1 Tax=Caulobacter endophyticus TaxID=2172652 RepID=UPI00240F5228|nr:ABC transporter substrate-binding protein [Caulobacter endophyticus]MDG2527234.1 ABC transporter substrate-binding protein [Caulobacter endophyticus]